MRYIEWCNLLLLVWVCRQSLEKCCIYVQKMFFFCAFHVTVVHNCVGNNEQVDGGDDSVKLTMNRF